MQITLTKEQVREAFGELRYMGADYCYKYDKETRKKTEEVEALKLHLGSMKLGNSVDIRLEATELPKVVLARKGACRLGKDLKGNPLPPGIMQRKSGIYRGRFYYKGETYTKDNADLKKLVQEMEDLRYEVKHGLKGKGDNITLDTWFDIWLNTHKKRTIKESTQVRYDDFYRRYIKKQIGKQRVADFNPIILERLLQNMADDDYSTKTIRDVYNILNR